MRDTEAVKNFSINLRYLCGFYNSISEVCRKLEINRPQFNRYLAGKSFPSYSNLKKICNFFGVETEEITETPTEFEKKLSPTNNPFSHNAIPSELNSILLPLLTNSSRNLQRYEGYYYRYFYSFGFPGYIFRSFMKIYQSNGVYYMKHIEHYSGRNPELGARLTIKNHGVVFLLADRLFLIESEPELNSTISETILTPSYRPNNPYMSGLVICASTSDSHQPGAARTVIESLGENIDIRKAMKQCDLFHHDDERIPEAVKKMIKNEIDNNEFTLHPLKN